MAGDEPRTVKLFCPSLTKLTQLVAWDDQKLDLGSIARTFGLDPSTLKINGHFISRGVDLIASSVTWRSLLSFFSSKGLSTGKDENDAIIIDGKLSKVGAKRKCVGTLFNIQLLLGLIQDSKFLVGWLGCNFILTSMLRI